MKIIYIPVTKKITERNLKNYIKCFIYDIYIILKNFFPKTRDNNVDIIEINPEEIEEHDKFK